MPGGEGKTKNNMAGRVGSGLLFTPSWEETTCASHAPRIAVTEEPFQKPPARSPSPSPRGWLLTGDDMMEGFQASHKGEGKKRIFCYGDIVLKSLPWFFPCLFPLQIGRKERVLHGTL